jgi:hypothetical protein
VDAAARAVLVAGGASEVTGSVVSALPLQAAAMRNRLSKIAKANFIFITSKSYNSSLAKERPLVYKE